MFVSQKVEHLCGFPLYILSQFHLRMIKGMSAENPGEKVCYGSLILQRDQSQTPFRTFSFFSRLLLCRKRLIVVGSRNLRQYNCRKKLR